MGDVVIADYSAKRVDPKDGSANEEIFGASGKGTQLDTTDTTLLPGMVSSILGMTRGETRTFDVIFPMDWEPASLRGSAGRFSLTVKELFSSQLPELNDAIAQKLAVGCNTMEEVRTPKTRPRRSLVGLPASCFAVLARYIRARCPVALLTWLWRWLRTSIGRAAHTVVSPLAPNIHRSHCLT
eukprot:jgi/Mesvir1/25179/Mv08892-RA.1